MTYKDNQPTFNVNRKVVNFKDFSANPNAEKEELKKMNKQNKPNTDDQQKNMGNSRYKFNHTTRKMDYLSPVEIKDSIEAIEEFEESNENSPPMIPRLCLIGDFDLKKRARSTLNHLYINSLKDGKITLSTSFKDDNEQIITNFFTQIIEET